MMIYMKIKAKNENTHAKGKKKPKQPKRITETYLHNSGLYYLQRFAASTGQFRKVMTRKIHKSCYAHTDQDVETCTKMLEDLIVKFIDLGLLNDEQYTKGMITSLRRQGKSRKAIFAKLREKALPADTVAQALQAYDEQTREDAQDAELYAALIHARKKRLGPFQGQKDIPYEKALGSMARAGYSYDIAQRVFEFTPEDAQQKLLDG